LTSREIFQKLFLHPCRYKFKIFAAGVFEFVPLLDDLIFLLLLLLRGLRERDLASSIITLTSVPAAAHHPLHCCVQHFASAFCPGCPAPDLPPSAAGALSVHFEDSIESSIEGTRHVFEKVFVKISRQFSAVIGRRELRRRRRRKRKMNRPRSVSRRQ
jgi:hypothetical protein